MEEKIEPFEFGEVRPRFLRHFSMQMTDVEMNSWTASDGECEQTIVVPAVSGSFYYFPHLSLLPEAHQPTILQYGV